MKRRRRDGEMSSLRVCPSSFFHLRPVHLFTSSAKFRFCPSIRRELRLIPSRPSSSSSSSFRRSESFPASCSSPTPVTGSGELQNQTLGEVDEGDKIKRKLEEFNWDHSFVKELPGDPRSDIIPRKVNNILVVEVQGRNYVNLPMSHHCYLL